LTYILMKNLFDLSNQHLLITGAFGAIGAAAARACAELGAKLTIADLRAPEALASELGSNVRAVALDNTSRDQVDALVASISPVDGLIDCSGYYVKGDWLEDGDAWDSLLTRTIDVNVRGPVNLVRACLPSMMARGSGRIVLMGSICARNSGTTLSVEPAYVASKGSLHALVRYFARQAAAHGVVVNGIAPGPVLTPLLRAGGQPFEVDSYPMKRLGEPEEIAWPIAFLCSPGTSFMTGVVLDVNGGMVFS
jgi:NAD(P)-dependent dehydrogenase (short-subunit alcohol dehydrogenase family)